MENKTIIIPLYGAVCDDVGVQYDHAWLITARQALFEYNSLSAGYADNRIVIRGKYT